MFSNYPDVLTVEQVAEALNICIGLAYRLIKEGQLGYKRIGRRILVPKVCLVDYISSARTDL